MYLITNIVDEYKRLRTHGLDVNEAIHALESHIGLLEKDERHQLSQHLRAWETAGRASSTSSDTAITLNMGELLEQLNIEADDDVVICVECAEPNATFDPFCRACGQMLMSPSASTDMLPPATGELHHDAYFSSESLLLLFHQDDPQPIVLRPSLSNHDLTLGRRSDKSVPDVDLTPFDAGKFGVSRLHATVSYDEIADTVHIVDLGSTNGTHLNAHRLQLRERRVLRDGDVILLGKLKLHVRFQH